TDVAKLLSGDALRGAEADRQGLDHGRRIGHAVELDPVAGVENGKLSQSVQRGQLLAEGRQALWTEGEFFAPLERRRVMAGSHDEQNGTGRAHGAETAAAAGDGVCRLEFTGAMESSAAANNPMHTQESR